MQKTILSMLIVLILVIASVGLVILKNYNQTIQKDSVNNVASNSNERPANLYKYAIINSKPALVFFHSNNCDSCIQMIQVINEIYPEFEEQVILVDVNVYEEQNRGLISQLEINYIPTLVFYNRAGEEITHVGVIESKDLHEELSRISQ
jgi:thioredoxin-like negative regulator of GroEL